MSTETSLEKAADRTPAIITTPEEYRGALLLWQARHYNILTPFSHISSLAQGHALVTTLITIDPDPERGDVWVGGTKAEGGSGLPWLKKGEFMIAKTGLRKIAEGGAISTTTVRTDPRTERHYWEIKAVASWRGIDGSTVRREASQEWDARDGSPRLKGFTANQVDQARVNGLRHCESRATNAAIREYGLKQKYSAEEIAKPFVIVRVMFIPDMNDPATKQLVTEQALRGTAALYPSHASALPPAAEPYEGFTESHREPVSVGRSSTAAPAGKTAESAKPDPDQPPTPDAVRIVKVESKTGETKGRPWTLWTVVDTRGVEYSTFDSKIAEAAERFKTARTWVDIADEQRGEYRNITEIASAQPSLLPDPGNL